MGTGGMVLMGPAQPLKHVIDELSLELGLISIRKHAVVRLQDAQRRFDSDIYIYIYLRSLLSQHFCHSLVNLYIDLTS